MMCSVNRSANSRPVVLGDEHGHRWACTVRLLSPKCLSFSLNWLMEAVLKPSL
jgi:hypothetical protein